MSSLDMPTFFNAFSVTAAGAVSMIVGSDPLDAKPLIFARGFRPAFSPNSFEPTSHAPDPFQFPDELPTVRKCLRASIRVSFAISTAYKPSDANPEKDGFK